jgi:hypothetical protein
VTEFQTAHTHFGSADCWCSAAGHGAGPHSQV